MSTFTLKMEIADNRHYNGQLSPLFTAAEAEKARAFHQAVEATSRHHYILLTAWPK